MEFKATDGYNIKYTNDIDDYKSEYLIDRLKKKFKLKNNFFNIVDRWISFKYDNNIDKYLYNNLNYYSTSDIEIVYYSNTEKYFKIKIKEGIIWR